MFFYKMVIKNNIESFKTIRTKRELAEVLGAQLKNLVYNLHVLPPQKRYRTFTIPKKRGGSRAICTPNRAIKHIQRNLADILLDFQSFRPCVHGYVKSKSIKTNAAVHRKKRIIINLDLEDFFGSINFGRVRGIFQSKPFDFNDIVATTLAQICCHNGVLPQGAPTSPVISNYICRKLDSELAAFARKYKMCYSRYADDITLSTNQKYLPAEIGSIENNHITLGAQLTSIIESNGFSVNSEKTRYAMHNNRQDVTGLIVNETVNVPRRYVKRIRAMLHAWEKYGIERAAKEHFEKFNYKHKDPDYPEIAYRNELRGMINYVCHIKGSDSTVYRTLFSRIKSLCSDIKITIPTKISIPENATRIYCEGKTDGMHLAAALKYFVNKGEFTNLNLYFHKWHDEYEINNSALFQICRNLANHKDNNSIEIFLFDRDDREFSESKLCDTGKNYKHWGEKVYSTLLPIPAHRNFNEICIEHFYSDTDLRTPDEKGYRIYTCDEFDPETGCHKTDPDIYFSDKHSKLKCTYPRILDSNVRNRQTDKNIALSKKVFATNIANRKGNFSNISFEYFRPIFQLFQEIIQSHPTP